MKRSTSCLIHCIHQHNNRRAPLAKWYKESTPYNVNVTISYRSIITTTTHKHTHQATLQHIHPRQLYQIINNVDEYYKFLPYCQESKILQTSKCGTMYDAVLRVGLPGLSSSSSSSSSDNTLFPSSSLLEERYVSRVKMIPPTSNGDGKSDSDSKQPMWTVEAKSIQSQLFDSLRSRWQLTYGDDAEYDNGNGNMQTADKNNSQQQQGGIGNDNRLVEQSSCNVNFEVEIQVSNPIISYTLNKVLKDVAKKQVDAFERRCHDIKDGVM